MDGFGSTARGSLCVPMRAGPEKASAERLVRSRVTMISLAARTVQ